MIMMKDFFKEISNHPNYIVTKAGDVISKKSKKKLQPDMSNGYPRVQLDGEKHYISYLVADAFIPHSVAETRVVYNDGNSNNTRVSNLKWESEFDAHRIAYAHRKSD